VNNAVFRREGFIVGELVAMRSFRWSQTPCALRLGEPSRLTQNLTSSVARATRRQGFHLLVSLHRTPQSAVLFALARIASPQTG
jgi:hypothetical protein